MNVKEAKSVAFGSKPSYDIFDFYAAWQWLYDNGVELEEADRNYLDKLICDGNVVPKEGYFQTRIV